MIEILNAIFDKHDVMNFGAPGEYDLEVELLVANIDQLENANDVRECLEFVFNEMFEIVPEFSDEFVAEVVEAIGK